MAILGWDKLKQMEAYTRGGRSHAAYPAANTHGYVPLYFPVGQNYEKVSKINAENGSGAQGRNAGIEVHQALA
jgi:hypothetical protein